MHNLNSGIPCTSGFLVDDPEKRALLQDYLLNNQIYSKVYFAPIHLKSYYRKKYGYNHGLLPVTESISNKILTLPISLNFTREDQNYIISKIKEFMNK